MTTHGHFLINLANRRGPAVWKGRFQVLVVAGPTSDARYQIQTLDGRYRMVPRDEVEFVDAQVNATGSGDTVRGDSTPADSQGDCGAVEDVGRSSHG